MPVSIFISYRHESPEFKQKIAALTVWLRGQGLEVISDQDYAATPPQGWTRWMEQSVEKAQVVLVVCTRGYRDNFEGKDLGAGGRGTVWEGAIISGELYEAKRYNQKFIPIQPDGEPFESLPKVLRDFHNSLYFPSASEKILQAIHQMIDWQNGMPSTVTPPPPSQPPTIEQLRVMAQSGELQKLLDLLDKIFETSPHYSYTVIRQNLQFALSTGAGAIAPGQMQGLLVFLGSQEVKNRLNHLNP
jgi:hypothetical protein